MYLKEASSIIKRTKLSKIRSYAGRSAISICKAENPNLYDKYKRFKDKYKEMKAQITVRYGRRGMRDAKSLIR
jgi:hypothetical protein